MLTKEIDADQKSGELTLKEAESLKKHLSKITEQETNWKNENGGKLSYANQEQLEKELNKISLTLKKKQLQKRVEQ
jgi:hypothetical protein